MEGNGSKERSEAEGKGFGVAGRVLEQDDF